MPYTLLRSIYTWWWLEGSTAGIGIMTTPILVQRGWYWCGQLFPDTRHISILFSVLFSLFIFFYFFLPHIFFLSSFSFLLIVFFFSFISSFSPTLLPFSFMASFFHFFSFMSVDMFNLKRQITPKSDVKCKNCFPLTHLFIMHHISKKRPYQTNSF